MAAARPRISVLIPTYEPQPFLVDTVKSVLAQDPGASDMQIAIVDDGSRSSRAADLIAPVAPANRMEIYEHADNLGLAGSWNRAVSYARGDFIHILHQDDVVCPGFYDRLIAGLTSNARIGMAFCRHAFTNEDDVIDRISHRERWTAGRLHRWLERIAVSQRIQCPAAIVKRGVYEQLGGFKNELRYALDWDMWVRIAAQYEVWYEPSVLARYRRHRAAETARLDATDRNLDLLRAIETFAAYLPPPERARLTGRAYREVTRKLLKRATKLEQSSPQSAANLIGCARTALERLPDGLAKRLAQRKLVRVEAQLARQAATTAR